MDLFTEAGIAAYLSLALFVGALVALTKRHPVDGWALAILATGAAGAGLGQRLVGRAAEQAPTLADKVEILAVGGREAAANSLVAGILVVILVAVGAAAARWRSAD